jgi:hypothetical protein
LIIIEHGKIFGFFKITGSRTMQTAIGTRERVWILRVKRHEYESGGQAGAKKLENTVVLFSGIRYKYSKIGGTWDMCDQKIEM